MPTTDTIRLPPPCLHRIWESCNGSTWQGGEHKGELCDCAQDLVERLRRYDRDRHPRP